MLARRIARLAGGCHRQTAQLATTHRPSTFKFPAVESNSPDTFGNIESICPTLPPGELDKGNVSPFSAWSKEDLDDGDGEEQMADRIASGDLVSSSLALNHIHELLREPCPDVEAALKYYDVDMKQDMVKPIPPVMRVLIHACGKSGNFQRAFDIFADYKSRHYGHNFGIIADLFNACANAPKSQHAQALSRANLLRQELLGVQNVPSVVYNNMIKAVGLCGDLEAAFDIVDQVHNQFKAINQDTVRHLLMACISDKEAGFRHALLLWRKVRGFKLAGNLDAKGNRRSRKATLLQGGVEGNNQLTVETYNLMLRAAKECGVGDQRQVQQLLIEAMPAEEVRRIGAKHQQDLKRLGTVSDGSRHDVNVLQLVDSGQKSLTPVLPNFLDPNPRFDGVDIMGLGSLDRPQDRLFLMGRAEGLLRTMSQVDRQKPDVKTFSLLMSCVEDTSEAEDELVSLMGQYKVTPDTDFYNQLMHKGKMRYDYRRIKTLLANMTESGLSPNLVTFNHLACTCRNAHQASKLLRDMKRVGAMPNTHILTTLAVQGTFHFQPDLVHLALSKHEEFELQPDDYIMSRVDKFVTDYRKALVAVEKGNQQGLAGLKVHQAKAVTEKSDGAEWADFVKFYEQWKKDQRPKQTEKVKNYKRKNYHRNEKYPKATMNIKESLS